MVEIATLRHVSTSGNLAGTWWQFLPRAGLSTNRVLAMIPHGPRIVEVEVPVCSNARPAAGHWFLVRRNPAHWVVTAARYEGAISTPAEEAFDKHLPVGSIVLAGASMKIDAEMRVV